MKKLIAVTASLMFAVSAISVNAANISEAKISVSDLIECVNVKTEDGKGCKLLFGLLDCIGKGECNLPEINLGGGTLSDIIEGIIGSLPNGKPDTETPDVNVPDTNVPETEVPDNDTPESDRPDTNLPDINIPDTDIPSEPDTDVPENDNNQNGNAGNGFVSQSEYVNEVLRLVNKYRAQNGLGALTLDSALCSAADVRAKEIKTSFSHTRPDGTSCFTVLGQLGISYGGAGENIAYGQSSPEEVMTAWMNSDGHRANILNSSFTKLGVGVYSSGGTLYWAQMFTY